MFRASNLRVAAALLAVTAGSLPAQIAVDSSLHLNLTNPTGPNYIIGADLGALVGTNLFHSFTTFNLAANQSATFQGPAFVQNIIGRITGGSVSTIDGAIRSEIAGANLFLLNPNGMIFGPKASLDVKASFHASTADYLLLGDGARYYSSLQRQSVLAAAPPQAFGFLSPAPSGIAINGSVLGTPTGSSLSFTAGKLQLSGSDLVAPGGTIALTARTVAGESPLNASLAPTGPLGGDITLSDSRLHVSSQDAPGGTVFVRAGRFVMEQASTIYADSKVSGQAGGVAITTDGDVSLRQGSSIDASTSGVATGGAIVIRAGGKVLLAERDAAGNGSSILFNAADSSSSGQVSITAGSFEMRDSASILGVGSEDGRVGGISVDTGDFKIAEDAALGMQVKDDSSAGSIHVKAKDLTIDGEGGDLRFARIFSFNSGAGATGKITVETTNLKLTGGGQIFSQTAKPAEGAASGTSGAVDITASQSMSIAGSPVVSGYRVASGASSFSDGHGAAGGISITTPALTLLDDGHIDTRGEFANAGNIQLTVGKLVIDSQRAGAGNGNGISSLTLGPARAGDITINASESVTLTGGRTYPRLYAAGNDDPADGIFSDTYSSGQAGSISITAPALTLNGGALIRAGQGANIYTGETVTGSAGRIVLDVGDLKVMGGSRIETQAVASGKSGDISIHAGSVTVSGATRLPDGSLSPSGIFSDAFALGAGGTIGISANTIALHDGGAISAENRGSGDAGSIQLTVGSAMSLRGATISTASGQGGGGSIGIQWSGGNPGRLILEQSAILTSVSGGPLNAGNVFIGGAVAVFPSVVLNQSQIRANARTGAGGQIVIKSSVFLGTPQSILDASAGPAGVDGFVRIDSPVAQLGGNFLPVRTAFVAEQVQIRCGQSTRGSTLTTLGYQAPVASLPGIAAAQWPGARPLRSSCVSPDLFGIEWRR